MQNSFSAGLSLPKDILLKIDEERGDVLRSRYIHRILEGTYLNTGTQNVFKAGQKDSPSGRIETHTLNEHQRSCLVHELLDKQLCEAYDCNELATDTIEVNVGTYGVIKLNVCKSCISRFLETSN